MRLAAYAGVCDFFSIQLYQTDEKQGFDSRCVGSDIASIQ